jgi:hypothetical protein
MKVEAQQIISASKEVWTNHLGLTLTPRVDTDAAADERSWSSCVKLSGSWQGAILLECSESIVRHAAAMLFAADGEDTPEDELADAVKELADMFGKKMRPFLPAETKVSRPTIVEDQGTCKALIGARTLSELNLTCEGRPLRIVLFESEPEAVVAAG